MEVRHPAVEHYHNPHVGREEMSPRLARFLLPLAYAESHQVGTVLLTLRNTQVRNLVGLLGHFMKLNRALGDSAAISRSDELTVQTIDPFCAPRRLMALREPLKGIPLEPAVPNVDGHLLRHGAVMSANQKGIRWTVPSFYMRAGYHTGHIIWEDLLEWSLIMTTRTGVPGAFRRLALFAPDRALEVLKDGTSFPRWDDSEPYRVSVAPEAWTPLLTHDDRWVREKAIALLGSRSTKAGTRPSVAPLTTPA